jgi:plasmid replication initiation protein
VATPIDEYVVVIQREIARASYDLTKREKLLLWGILSKIKPYTKNGGNGTNITPEEWYSYTVPEYERLCSITHNDAYEELKEAGDKLYERYIRISGLESKKSVHKIRWFSETIYMPEEQIFKVRFSVGIIPYLSNIQKHFIQLKIKDAVKLNNEYAWKLFDRISEYRGKGQNCRQLEMFPMELCEMLNVPESCKMYKNLKGKVLLPAFKELEKHELAKVWIESEQTVGRKVVSLILRFEFG